MRSSSWQIVVLFLDICNDSSDISDSDTDSQCSSISQPSLGDGPVDTIATMQVVEYEVASATESEAEYLSDASSSGTDVSSKIWVFAEHTLSD